MAYLGHIESNGAEPIALPPIGSPIVPADEFTALEWSVIRLARIDRLWTIRRALPGRRFWNWLAGRGNPALANERLEALRKISVLSWHFGYTVDGRDVTDFLSAGFSSDQYELLVNSIRKAQRSRVAPRLTRAFA
jgi:hypothetical protein